MGWVSIPGPSRLISGASCFRPQRQATSCQETSASQVQGPRVQSCGQPRLLLPGSPSSSASPGLWRRHTTCSSDLRPVPHLAAGPTLRDFLQDFKSLIIPSILPNFPFLSPLHLISLQHCFLIRTRTEPSDLCEPHQRPPSFICFPSQTFLRFLSSHPFSSPLPRPRLLSHRGHLQPCYNIQRTRSCPHVMRLLRCIPHS